MPQEIYLQDEGNLYQVDVTGPSYGAVTIYFGSSFTLRLDEKNIDKLRELLYEVSRDLALARVAKAEGEKDGDV
tara:strand:+ start:4121 stop:4342 length:222 start_codon:yes stop_codon:yes gene_type:complete